MFAKDYIKDLLSIEHYSFSIEEISQHVAGNPISLKGELARLVQKKEIINLRKGFYLIIPPRYSKQSQLPVQLYISKLCQHLNRNYYIAFYSAAKFHGASHQQAQREYIMTSTPSLPNIKKHALNIHFFTTSIWPETNILEKKSDAGVFNISSPALTAIDLIHHQTKLGGLNRMLAILEELFEEINANDILDLLTWYPHKSSLQRFGFLLEKIQANDEIHEPIMEFLQQKPFFPVLLSPKFGQKPGAVCNYWKVDVNIKMDSDLDT